jgi:hypothetical protein
MPFSKLSIALRVFITIGMLTAGTSCKPPQLTKPNPAAPIAIDSLATVLKTESITINEAALSSPKIKFSALGRSLLLVGSPSLRKADGRMTWVGKIDKDDKSLVVFATRPPAVEGLIRGSDGSVIEITGAQGKQIARLLDGNSFPPDILASSSLAVAPLSTKKCSTIQNDPISVAIYYTTAMQAEKGDAASLAQIDAAIESANKVLATSGARVRLQLTDSGVVSYTESTDPSFGARIDLNALTNPSDGQMDDLIQRRADKHADVVVVVGKPRTCGIAWQLDNTTGQPELAFAVVNSSCFVNLGLIHEIGHIMGANHDLAYLNQTPENDDTGPYPYGHGFTNTKTGEVTIMSYGAECPRNDPKIKCHGIPYFSSSVLGLGKPEVEDNVRVINELGPLVASYRCDNTSTAVHQSRLTYSSIQPTDQFGNYWYLDRREQPVKVTFENNGTVPWTSSFALTLVAPATNKNIAGGTLSNVTRVPLNPGETIAPGQSKTFDFNFIGEGYSTEFQWQLVDDAGTPFGDRTPIVALQPKGF